MFVDLPLEELRQYRPDVAEPADFDAFWSAQLTSARSGGGAATFDLVTTPIRQADVFDVTFPGYGNDPIRAWLLVPHDLPPDRALVVEYVGYGGGRGHPLDWLTYSVAGHPHFVMDTRGQGGGWRSADTPDPRDPGTPSTPGFLTRGIADPATSYYTRLFVDAARAVDAVRTHPVAESRPLVTAGGSQGGALALAAAHLAGDVAATLPDVPFLSHVRRAVQITDSKPFGESRTSSGRSPTSTSSITPSARRFPRCSPSD
jgi:cephalosporin-C deacetylase